MAHIFFALKIVLAVVALFAPFFLLIAIIVPIVARRSGIPFKVGAIPTYRRDERLNKRQSFWFAGVLGWGFGFFLTGALAAVLTAPKQFTISQLLYGLISCLVFGALSQGDWTYPVDKSE
jgi:hypothetical protein